MELKASAPYSLVELAENARVFQSRGITVSVFIAGAIPQEIAGNFFP
jgi:hypothetical protein